MARTALEDDQAVKWVKVIDQTRCIGCHACTVACKSENEVPLGVTRTYVKSVDVGIFPQVRRNFQVTRCNQCENPPCVSICPTGAMFKRPDGIVDFDKSICIGCKACIAACPYDAIFMNPDDHCAEKCNFCAHRIEIGLEPACVTVCPVEAILVGNINNPNDKVTQIINRQSVTVRRPEKSTRPKLFYKGASQATLDPIAAAQPVGDTFMWSQMANGPGIINSGHPGKKSNYSPAAKLSYDVSHAVPWGWKVSGYTWTKAIGTGTILALLLLISLGRLPVASESSRLYLPLIAVAGLLVTAALLVSDLKHPERVMLLFLRPRFESWLVKGGFLLGIDGALVVAWSALSYLSGPKWPIYAVGFLLAAVSAMTAVYTGFLFAQAKARDLWQSPLRTVHLLDQAMLVGFAMVALMDGASETTLVAGSITSIIHIVLVFLETVVAHPTEHGHLAVHLMTRGKYAFVFWIGVITAIVGILAPILGVGALVIGAIGLLGYEHAYIQAGQSVPLA